MAVNSHITKVNLEQTIESKLHSVSQLLVSQIADKDNLAVANSMTYPKGESALLEKTGLSVLNESQPMDFSHAKKSGEAPSLASKTRW